MPAVLSNPAPTAVYELTWAWPAVRVTAPGQTVHVRRLFNRPRGLRMWELRYEGLSLQDVQALWQHVDQMRGSLTRMDWTDPDTGQAVQVRLVGDSWQFTWDTWRRGSVVLRLEEAP